MARPALPDDYIQTHLVFLQPGDALFNDVSSRLSTMLRNPTIEEINARGDKITCKYRTRGRKGQHTPRRKRLMVFQFDKDMNRVAIRMGAFGNFVTRSGNIGKYQTDIGTILTDDFVRGDVYFTFEVYSSSRRAKPFDPDHFGVC